MSFDLITKQTTGRNWARDTGLGEKASGSGSWASEKALELARKKIPWKQIAIGAGMVAGIFLVLPSLFGKRGRAADIKRTREMVRGWPEEVTAVEAPVSSAELMRRGRRAG